MKTRPAKKTPFTWAECWIELNRLKNSIRSLFCRMRDLSPANLTMQHRTLKVASIAISFAADVVHVPEKKIIGRRGKADVVWGRHIAIAVTREITGEPLEYIKRAFKLHDHTIVSYACKRVAQTPEEKYRLQYQRVLELTRKAVGQLEPVSGTRVYSQAADTESLLEDKTMRRRRMKTAAQKRRRAISHQLERARE